MLLKKIQNILRQEGVGALSQRALVKLLSESRWRYEEARARRTGSYSLGVRSRLMRLTPRLDSMILGSLSLEECIPQPVAQHYIDHRFDLLGSGWVHLRYGMHCRGMASYHYGIVEEVVPDAGGEWLLGRLNPSNAATSQRIWQRVDVNYQPIDWQLDFKSGHRWSEGTWARRLTYGHQPGVDVKVPWELARMQHLPQMALRAAMLGVDSEEAQRLVDDIRNQLFDFIATNPPGFGVNWVCPMDIAIRGANWCLAWDLMQAAGFQMAEVDESIVAHSLLDHGRYLVTHLEWTRERANHYLANICGLAFIGSYLPETPESDRWLAFAIGQLEIEIFRQFLPDGGNFEGSIAYHRLSTEMLVYASAIILGLPQTRISRIAGVNPKNYAYLPRFAGAPKSWSLYGTAINEMGEYTRTPFRPEFVNRLHLAVSFFAHLLKPDYTFPQIGDNDSGRFFKMVPIYSTLSVAEARERYLNLGNYFHLDERSDYHFEMHCCGRHLLAAAAGVGIRLTQACTYCRTEGALVKGLAKARRFVVPPEFRPYLVDTGDKGGFMRITARVANHPDRVVRSFPILQGDSTDASNIEHHIYPDFGVHVWRRKQFMVTVRAIETCRNPAKGHFHDDQLSLEITLGDVNVIKDPGTYVYTALPIERNRYRSASAHFPYFQRSTKRLVVFEAPELAPVNRVYSGCEGFAGICVSADTIDYLILSIKNAELEILTLTQSNAKKNDTQDVAFNVLPYSPGYGIQQRP